MHTGNSRTGEVEAGGPRAQGHLPLYKIQVEPGLYSFLSQKEKKEAEGKERREGERKGKREKDEEESHH